MSAARSSETHKITRRTDAAKWNATVMRLLQAALIKDPEADLTTIIPHRYSEKLRSCKQSSARSPALTCHNDIRSRLDPTEPYTVVCEISSELASILPHDNTPTAIVDLLTNGEALYKSRWASSVTVFRVSELLVAKFTNEQYAVTEFGSLSYLQEHLPAFPAPRPHGVVRLGAFCLLFTSFVPGLDLEKVWDQLEENQKVAIGCQLDKLLAEMRSLPYPEHLALGGVRGEGCKDSRRALRANHEPIKNAKEFENWVYGETPRASGMYAQMLRDLLPTSTARCVFTHGDIRPANIIVSRDEDNIWKVVAIIDWETSGFYPEYWECVKLTNNLTPKDSSDWYRHLPHSISLHRYKVYWLIDRLLDRSMVNS